MLEVLEKAVSVCPLENVPKIYKSKSTHIERKEILALSEHIIERVVHKKKGSYFRNTTCTGHWALKCITVTQILHQLFTRNTIHSVCSQGAILSQPLYYPLKLYLLKMQEHTAALL